MLPCCAMAVLGAWCLVLGVKVKSARYWVAFFQKKRGPGGPLFCSVSVAAAVADIDSDIDVFDNNTATDGNN